MNYKNLEKLYEIGQKINWREIKENLKKNMENKETEIEPFKHLMELYEKYINVPVSVKNSGFPCINIYEYSDKYVFYVFATGFNKNEINLKIGKDEGKNTLIISGKSEFKVPSEKQIIQKSTSDVKPKTLKKEWKIDEFERIFKLNDDVDINNIKAHYENSILEITLSKSKFKNNIPIY